MHKKTFEIWRSH